MGHQMLPVAGIQDNKSMTKSTLAWALHAITAACAELISPSQEGLRDDLSPVHEDVKYSCEYFF